MLSRIGSTEAGRVLNAIAAYLGTHDGPTGPIRWRYSYLSGPEDRVVLVLKEIE